MLAAASGEVKESKTYKVWSPELHFGFLEPLILANFGVVHSPRVLKLGSYVAPGPCRHGLREDTSTAVMDASCLRVRLHLQQSESKI